MSARADLITRLEQFLREHQEFQDDDAAGYWHLIELTGDLAFDIPPLVDALRQAEDAPSGWQERHVGYVLAAEQKIGAAAGLLREARLSMPGRQAEEDHA